MSPILQCEMKVFYLPYSIIGVSMAIELGTVVTTTIKIRHNMSSFYVRSLILLQNKKEIEAYNNN